MINLRKFPRVEPKRETRMGNNWKSQTLLVGMKKGTFTLRKTAWQLLTKLTIHLIHDPTVPLLGMYPKELKTGFSINNKNLYVKVYSSTIHNSPKLGKNPNVHHLMNRLKKNVAISIQGNII